MPANHEVPVHFEFDLVEISLLEQSPASELASRARACWASLSP